LRQSDLRSSWHKPTKNGFCKTTIANSTLERQKNKKTDIKKQNHYLCIMTSRKEQLAEMLHEDPKDVFLHYALGLEFYKDGECLAGMDKMREIIAFDASYVPAYFQLAQWLVEEDSAQEAIQLLNSAMELTKKQKDEKAHREIAEYLFILKLSLEDDE
jgi:thioredoxin-like negative regulator of GroEL